MKTWRTAWTGVPPDGKTQSHAIERRACWNGWALFLSPSDTRISYRSWSVLHCCIKNHPKLAAYSNTDYCTFALHIPGGWLGSARWFAFSLSHSRQVVARARVHWRLAHSCDWCLAWTTPTAGATIAGILPASLSPAQTPHSSWSERARQKLFCFLRLGLWSHLLLLCYTLMVEEVTKACPMSQGGDRCSTSWQRKSKSWYSIWNIVAAIFST